MECNIKMTNKNTIQKQRGHCNKKPKYYRYKTKNNTTTENKHRSGTTTRSSPDFHRKMVSLQHPDITGWQPLPAEQEMLKKQEHSEKKHLF